jgi:hypothetical protein
VNIHATFFTTGFHKQILCTVYCVHITVCTYTVVYIYCRYIYRIYIYRLYIYRVYIYCVFIYRVNIHRLYIYSVYIHRVYIYRVYIYRVYIYRLYIYRYTYTAYTYTAYTYTAYTYNAYTYTAVYIIHIHRNRRVFFVSPIPAPWSNKSNLLIQSAVCLKTDPQRLPKPFLHRLRSSASSFQFPVSSHFLKVIQ